MIIMFLVFILAQAIGMIVDWNSTMSTSATATLNAATDLAAATNPFNWGDIIKGIWNIASWNYSFLQGGWIWLRIVGMCFTFAMLWPILQLLVYAIGGIISKVAHL
jgi:hypothetical protein